MFPWNYGFHWTAGTIIFMGAFYTVLCIVAITVVRALWRSRRAMAGGKTEHIRWHSDFHDLTPQDKVCRHVLTGEFRERQCPNSFDCRRCPTHAKLVAHREEVASAGQADACGMAFPLDRYYHRGHTWAQPQSDGTMTVGIDELGKRLVGTPEAVELPEPGTHIEANGTAFRVSRRGTTVRILSPVDGEVVETGGADRGWFLKVKPTGDRFDVRHLLRGREVRLWVMREMERLQLALSRHQAFPTLADGGTPVDDIAAACPAADWDAVCGQMFLEP